MDPALSSQAVSMPAEFSYCQHTLASNSNNTRGCILIENDSSPSPTPARRKSRLFDTFKFRSRSNSRVSNENASPKSLTRSKSIVGLFPFASTRSRKVYDRDGDSGSTEVTRPSTTSPSKENPRDKGTFSRNMKRRMSLGDILGSISHNIHSKKSMVPQNTPTQTEDPGAKTVEVDIDIQNPSLSKLIHRVGTTPPNNCFLPPYISFAESSSDNIESFVSRLERMVDDLKDTQIRTGLDSRRSSSSSSTACASETPDLRSSENPAVLNAMARHAYNGPRIKTPDSYLCLLVETYTGIENFPSPSQESQELSPTPSPFKAQPVEPTDFLEDRYSGPDAANQSSSLELGSYSERPPSYSEISEVKNGKIQQQYRIPQTTTSEVRSSQNSENPGVEISQRLEERNGQHRSIIVERGSPRESKLLQSDNADEVAERTKLTARMGKTHHLGTSLVECLAELSGVPLVQHQESDDNGFKTDQAIVWNSIRESSRMLEQAKPLCTQLLRKKTSNGEFHQCGTTDVGTDSKFEDLLDFQTLLPEKGSKPSPSHVETAPSIAYMKGLLDDIDRLGSLPNAPTQLIPSEHHNMCSNSLKCRKASTTLVTVEFPKTVNLESYKETYGSKNEAISALYDYKLSELSNFCTFDPHSQTIYAHPLEARVPSPAELKHDGLEILWLPMAEGTCGFGPTYSLAMGDLESAFCEQLMPKCIDEKTYTTQEEQLQNLDGNEEEGRSNSVSEMDPRSDSEDLVASFNHKSFGIHFEQRDCIESPSSRDALRGFSSVLQDASSAFGDGFSQKIDRDDAQDFSGSQCSGDTTSTGSLFERIEHNGPSDDLTIIRDTNTVPRPLATWPELGRAYRAARPDFNLMKSEKANQKLVNNGMKNARENSLRGEALQRNDYKSDGLHGVSGEGHRKYDYQNFPISSILYKTFAMESYEAGQNSSAMRETVAYPSSLFSPTHDGKDPLKDLKLFEEILFRHKPHDINEGHSVDRVPIECSPRENTEVSASGLSNYVDISSISGLEKYDNRLDSSPFATHMPLSWTEYMEAEVTRASIHQIPTSEPFISWYTKAENRIGERNHVPESVDKSGRSFSLSSIPDSSHVDPHINPEFPDNLGAPNGSILSISSSVDVPIPLASGFKFTAYHEYLALGDERNKRRESSVSINHCDVGETEQQMPTQMPLNSKISRIEETGNDRKDSAVSFAATVDSLIPENRQGPCLDQQVLGEDSTGRSKLESNAGSILSAAPDLELVELPFSDESKRVHMGFKIEDMNLRLIGKAAGHCSQQRDKEVGKVNALVDIFQSRGLMPQKLRSALHRPGQRPSWPSRLVGDSVAPSTRIVSRSGSVYLPSGTLCVATGESPKKFSPIKRVPTPHSPFGRPSSADTDVSSLFGESLERVERYEFVENGEKARDAEIYG